MWVWSKLSAIKWADAWEERFHGNPYSVISEIKGGKSVRVEVYCETKKDADNIVDQFGGSVRQLKSKNWASLGPVKIDPILICDRLVISPLENRAAVIKDYPERDVIIIPAEMAFGTGDHPTTSTCLRLLVSHSKNLKSDWSCLDMGTGSGVLAIAAKMLGAGEVQAFDFDAKAVEISQLNAARNEVSDIDFFEADVFEWKNRKRFDVVAANLFSTVLIEALPLMTKWIKKQGLLILSGILYGQWPEVQQTAERYGFKLIEHKKNGKWVTAHFHAPQS